MGVRADLAALIKAELSTNSIKGNVYADPADLSSFPAVVLEGDDPYIEPVGFRSGADPAPTAYRWSLEVHLLYQRAVPGSAYAWIEGAAAAVDTAIRRFPGRPGALSSIGTIEVNNTPAAAATMQVEIVSTERT